MVAGPAWLRIGPVPTKRPAPMIPPIEIMVMCRLFKPGCRRPSRPDSPRLSALASAIHAPSYVYSCREQLTRYARSFTTQGHPSRRLAGAGSDDDELQGPCGENLPPRTTHQAGVAQAHGDPAPGVGR